MADPLGCITEGRVLVDGSVVTNPASRVYKDARVVVRDHHHPRGADKLGPVLDVLGVDPRGWAVLDVGACTGGFTQAVLDRGARRVFAVDVGYGQLLGSLRQDPRVVNLERTNASEVTARLLGEPVELIVVDVTYVRLGIIVAELTVGLQPDPGAQLVGLVKPMFELERGELPVSRKEISEAGERASRDARSAGWQVLGLVESPLLGAHGAVELFMHCRWPGRGPDQP